MTELAAKIDALEKHLSKILEAWGYETTTLFQGLIGKKMGFRPTEADFTNNVSNNPFSRMNETWSKKKHLRLRSGKLFQSFKPTKEKVSATKQNIKLELSSDVEYANIHEKGGFIKATPITTKSGRKTYRMALWFWAQYYATKKQNEFFKIMALSVDKKGGVRMKKRSYFGPALHEFKTTKLKLRLQKLIDIIIQRVNVWLTTIVAISSMV